MSRRPCWLWPFESSFPLPFLPSKYEKEVSGTIMMISGSGHRPYWEIASAEALLHQKIYGAGPGLTVVH